MLVILKENIDNLGRVGDIVRVKPGYARNYLIPKNLVIVADEANVNSLEHFKRGLEKKREQGQIKAQELAAKLQEFSCTVSRKVGEQDKLYGSVTVSDISEAFKTGGFDIPKASILLDAPIKTLGVHAVRVRVHPEVIANCKVWVVKEPV